MANADPDVEGAAHLLRARRRDCGDVDVAVDGDAWRLFQSALTNLRVERREGGLPGGAVGWRKRMPTGPNPTSIRLPSKANPGSDQTSRATPSVVIALRGDLGNRAALSSDCTPVPVPRVLRFLLGDRPAVVFDAVEASGALRREGEQGDLRDAARINQPGMTTTVRGPSLRGRSRRFDSYFKELCPEHTAWQTHSASLRAAGNWGESSRRGMRGMRGMAA